MANWRLILTIIAILFVFFFILSNSQREDILDVSKKINPLEEEVLDSNLIRKPLEERIEIFAKRERITQNDLFSCKIDEDCIMVPPGCCGCSSGSGHIFINKNYEDDWRSFTQSICQQTACIAVISQHISCFSNPVCVENKCRSAPNKEIVCNSLLYENCKDFPPDNMDEILRGNGISCNEVIEICE